MHVGIVPICGLIVQRLPSPSYTTSLRGRHAAVPSRILDIHGILHLFALSLRLCSIGETRFGARPVSQYLWNDQTTRLAVLTVVLSIKLAFCFLERSE
jgi:hypothetical protein